jgi:hypothetical protein
MLVDTEDFAADTLKLSIPGRPKRRIGVARFISLIIPFAIGADDYVIGKTATTHAVGYFLDVFFAAGPFFFTMRTDFFATTFLTVFFAAVLVVFFFAGTAFFRVAGTLDTSTPQQ